MRGAKLPPNLALFEGFTTGWMQSCVFFSVHDISNEFPILRQVINLLLVKFPIYTVTFTVIYLHGCQRSRIGLNLFTLWNPGTFMWLELWGYIRILWYPLWDSQLCCALLLSLLYEFHTCWQICSTVLLLRPFCSRLFVRYLSFTTLLSGLLRSLSQSIRGL